MSTTPRVNVPIAGTKSVSATKSSITFSESFIFETSDPDLSPVAAFNGQPYFPNDFRNGYKIQSVNFADTDDSTKWICTVTYGEDDEEVENPLDQPWEWSVNFEQYQVNCEYDIHRKPILNTAKQFYDEPLTIDNSRPVLTGRKAFPFFPWNIANNLVDCVNGDNFQGCAKDTLKCERFGGQPQKFTYTDPIAGKITTTYYDVTVELSYKREGHQPQLLSKGTRELKDNKVVPILEAGVAITEPVLLDRAGKKLALGGNPVFEKKEVYRRTSFGGIFS